MCRFRALTTVKVVLIFEPGFFHYFFIFNERKFFSLNDNKHENIL